MWFNIDWSQQRLINQLWRANWNSAHSLSLSVSLIQQDSLSTNTKQFNLRSTFNELLVSLVNVDASHLKFLPSLELEHWQRTIGVRESDSRCPFFQFYQLFQFSRFSQFSQFFRISQFFQFFQLFQFSFNRCSSIAHLFDCLIRWLWCNFFAPWSHRQMQWKSHTWYCYCSLASCVCV